MGLVYDKEGKKEEALRHLEIVASLNPDNDTVKQMVNNLRAGRAAASSQAEITPPEEQEEASGKPAR